MKHHYPQETSPVAVIVAVRSMTSCFSSPAIHCQNIALYSILIELAIASATFLSSVTFNFKVSGFHGGMFCEI